MVSMSFVFYEGQVILVEHSARFEITAALSAVVKAGQKTLLVVRISNTGTGIGL